MKVSNVVTTKHEGKRIEILISKEDEMYLLQFALQELLEQGAVKIKKERDKFLLDIPAQGNG